ncbi:MAG: hypothetical protein U0270_45875 [Labilithrix sp.]
MERVWQDRIYSETLPWPELVTARVLQLLRRYGIELVLAVRPWDLEALPGVASALRDAGVPLSIWPMLDDEKGRWINVHNAHEFRGFVLNLCDLLRDAAPRDVLFDLEPPFDRARALIALAMRSHTLEGISRFAAELKKPSAAPFDAAAAELARTGADVRARGIMTSAAVWPLVALDPRAGQGWQALLGTPTDALEAGHVSVMMYTSIFEGWSRGTVRRRDARALLAAATVRTAKRFGDRAGISLGCVGTGAFADEPTYRDPGELADDVAVARASGVSKLTLFDLGGILARGPAEAWLDAFTAPTDAATAVPSRRVSAARAIARAATWAVSARRVPP